MFATAVRLPQYQTDLNASVAPPPGLERGMELKDAKLDKTPAKVVIDKMDALAGASSESNQPMKVKVANTDALVETSSAVPQTVVDAADAALALGHEALAHANAQLAWANLMLNQNSDCTEAAGEMLTQGWMPQQQWPMPPAWPQQPQTEPGDLVYFHGLQSATELNDEYAFVDRWDDESQRWIVRLPTGEKKFAKSQNLIVVRCPQAYGNDPYSQSHQTSASALSKNQNASTWSFGSMSTVASLNPDQCGQLRDWHDPTMARTTVMMRNIPNDYSRKMLVELLNEQGFDGCYNLVYLPMDYKRKASFGYAFVDFTTPEDADRFSQHFDGFSDWKMISSKVCCVGWSTVQGLQPHIERYRNSPVMHHSVAEEFKPMLFENGRHVRFPLATQAIRGPRLKTGRTNGA